MPGGHGYAQHQSWNHDGAAEFVVKCLASPVVQVVSRVSYVVSAYKYHVWRTL